MNGAALVGRGHSERDPPRGFEGLVDGHRSPRKTLAEVLAGDVLHGDESNRVGRVADRVQPVNGGDVGVVQRGEQLRLALEAAHPLGVDRKRGGEDLDGDVAVEARVAR